MSDYKDTFAYKMYQRAEENIKSGVAESNLLEDITRDISKAVSYGKTMVRYDACEHYFVVIEQVVNELRRTGFKVFREGIDFEELCILWDFSEEDDENEEPLETTEITPALRMHGIAVQAEEKKANVHRTYEHALSEILRVAELGEFSARCSVTFLKDEDIDLVIQMLEDDGYDVGTEVNEHYKHLIISWE